LMRRSSLVCIFDSSLGLDAIFHGIPLLIFGMPYFSTLLPKKFSSISEVDLNDISRHVHPLEPVLIWAFYLATSGDDLVL